MLALSKNSLIIIFFGLFTVLLITNIEAKYFIQNNEINQPLVDPLEVSALGRVAELGELYDARTDQFLQLSLMKDQFPNSTIISVDNLNVDMKYSLVNSFKEKFNTMDISASAKLSVLFGLIKLGGISGQFYKETKTSARSAKASLFYTSLTEYQQISITEDDLKPILNYDILNEVSATHIVVGIQWGGNVFITVEDSNYESQSKQKIEGHLSDKLQIYLASLDTDAKINMTDQDKSYLSQLSFRMYGDLVPDYVPQTLMGAFKLIQMAPHLINSANNGKGKALKYTLLPITIIQELIKNVTKDVRYETISESSTDLCVDIFDDLNDVQQKINDITSDLKTFSPFIQTKSIDYFRDLKREFEKYQDELKQNMTVILNTVRSGNESIVVFDDFLVESMTEIKTLDKSKLSTLDELKQEIAFVTDLTRLNVTLISKDVTLQQFLWSYYDKHVFVLFYNNQYSNEDIDTIDFYRDHLITNKNDPNYFYAAVKYAVFKEKNGPAHFWKNCTQINYYYKNRLVNENIDKTPLIHWQYSLKAYLPINAPPEDEFFLQTSKSSPPMELWRESQWRDVTNEFTNATINFSNNKPGVYLSFGEQRILLNFRFNTDINGTAIPASNTMYQVTSTFNFSNNNYKLWRRIN